MHGQSCNESAIGRRCVIYTEPDTMSEVAIRSLDSDEEQDYIQSLATTARDENG